MSVSLVAPTLVEPTAVAVSSSQVAATPAPLTHTVAIDIACQKATVALWQADQKLLLKPIDFTNDRPGFEWLAAKLAELAPSHQPACVQIGMEATGNYWENLHQYFAALGYRVILLNPQQTHQWAQKQGLRAKTDKLDTLTIGKLLQSGEARPAYVPDDDIANYRELVRLHTTLSDEAGRYKQQLHAHLFVTFPELGQVFADTSCKTALSLLVAYPGAAVMAAAGVEALAAKLKELAPRKYGVATAQKLHELAAKSASSGRAMEGRSLSLVILCQQLLALNTHLATLETRLAEWLAEDEAAQRLEAVPGFGSKTVAVLRAELGDVSRFCWA